MRATAQVWEVAPPTVLPWLVEAADHLQAFARHCLGEVHGRQLPGDGLYAVLSALQDGARSEDEAIRWLSPAPPWVGTALEPETQLLLVSAVGPRTLPMAQQVLQQGARCLAPDGVPRFLSDGCKDSLRALRAHVGGGVHPKRQQATGPDPPPRWLPLPQLL